MYRLFTAPWYHGDFDAGEGRLFCLKVTEVVAKKKMRSADGFNRMRVTLAAFYDHEPEFSQMPLDYLLMHSDVLMLRFPHAQTTRRNRERAPPERVSPAVREYDSALREEEEEQDSNANGASVPVSVTAPQSHSITVRTAGDQRSN